AWRGLWAQYGDAVDARGRYRTAFDTFAAAVRPLSRDLMLRNEMRWFDVMMVMLGRTVVSAGPAAA
ncbi:MAG: hypothetical protein M3Q11_04120, partial [Pseudomonadota bacterium]|nr:hypothetical protein [Pseudomonadota bacterium]